MNQSNVQEQHIADNPYRLFTNLVPIHYDIRLEIEKLENAGEDKYFGVTTLQFKVAESTSTIALNAKGIEFEYAIVFSAFGKEQKAVSIDVDNDKETVSFYFNEEISGENTLEVGFNRKFNPPNKMRGLHESAFTLQDGTKRVMATTQFESTHARECFPCCDDPAQKATFKTTLVVPEDRIAISTTEVVSEELLGNGLKEVQFAKTPVMPTYLLAFIVGDWEYLKSKTSDGVSVRVYATPGKKEKLHFALDTTVRALEWFSDYFAFPYKDIANKCDVLAIPDFEAGAMENIGAITFREVLLFVDEKRTSTLLRRYVAKVICHELAHQWKGNLVTPHWWDNLWLKESFATFMSYKAVDALFPEWKVWDEFVSSMASGAKILASLRSAHPIEVPVQNPDEIDQIYDAISYNMGGSVLRMLEDWLGEDVFRDGIRLYVDRHQFANTRTEDLWAALEEVSGEPVFEVMNSWTKQTGYPVVSVRRDGGKVFLLQERFLLEEDTRHTGNALWFIPVTYRTSSGAQHSLLLSEKETQLPVNADETLQLNIGQAGFFRVSYEKQDIEAVKANLSNLKIVDRLILAEDMYDLMRAGYVSVQDYLEFISAYANEDNYNVWNSVMSGLGALHAIFIGHNNASDLKSWIRDLLRPLAEKLGWTPLENEKEEVSLLRQTILSASVRFNNEEVVARARELFSASNVSLDNIAPDLHNAVLSAAARNGDRETFDEFVRRHKTAVQNESEFGPELVLKYLQNLSAFKDGRLLYLALDYSLSENVRPQDSVRVWSVPLKNKQLAWEYLKKNWAVLYEKFGSTRMIGAFIGGVVSGVPNKEFADEVEDFFQKNPASRATETIKHAIEGMRVRAQFRERNEQAFANYFTK